MAHFQMASVSPEHWLNLLRELTDTGEDAQRNLLYLKSHGVIVVKEMNTNSGEINQRLCFMIALKLSSLFPTLP